MTPKAYCEKYQLTGAEFGRRVGVSKFTACRLIKAEQRVSPKRAREIEERTGGEITRHDLRPDVFGPANVDAERPSSEVAEHATASQGQ